FLFFNSQRSHHHSLDRMHTVLCLVKHFRLFGLEHFVRHFHIFYIKTLTHFFSALCLQIVECGKTVQEDRAVFCVCHHFFCHFIWRELFNPLLPYFVRLSHGYPYICVDNVGIFCSLFYIGCQRDRCT